MTKPLTLRLPTDLLSRAEGRASQLGLDRAKYVRRLIERDLEENSDNPAPAHVFASEDLVGYYEGDGIAATNAVVREQVRQRAAGKR
jgi:predicted DNA-binding protein